MWKRRLGTSDMHQAGMGGYLLRTSGEVSHPTPDLHADPSQKTCHFVLRVTMLAHKEY